MNKQLIFFLIPLFVFTNSFSQNNTFCTCASYSSLRYSKDGYLTEFPPAVVKKNKFKEVLVRIYGREATDSSANGKVKVRKPLITEYDELRIRFDANGYVSEVLEYYNGAANTKMLYTRNANGNVVRKEMLYVDAMGNNLTGALANVKYITVYFYDDKQQLVKEKTLDPKGTEQPDAKSQYTEYRYDLKGRPVREYSYAFWDITNAPPTISITEIEYNDKDSSAKTTFTYNGSVINISNTKFLQDHKKKEEKFFIAGKWHTTARYTYDAAGNITSFTHQQADRTASECPETQNYTDTYSIGVSGLTEKIEHTFDGKTCEMNFVYR